MKIEDLTVADVEVVRIGDELKIVPREGVVIDAPNRMKQYQEYFSLIYGTIK